MKVSMQSAARLTLIALLIGSVGCAPRIGMSPGGAPGGPAGPAAPGGGPAAPGGGPLGQDGLPGPIGGPGASPEGPPTAVLPAPAGSASRIQQLVQKYGMRSIKGPNASEAQLGAADQAWANYPQGSFRDLDVVFDPPDPQAGGEDGVGSGVWFPTDQGGQPVNGPGTQIAGARTHYFGGNMHRWVLVHEIAHHVTLYQNTGLGNELVTGLGYRNTQNSGNIQSDLMSEGWDKSGVQQSAYPTEYSLQAPLEHAAEAVTIHFLGPQGLPPNSPGRQGYQPPAAVQGALDSRLPRRGGQA